MWRKNIWIMGLLALILAVMTQGQSPETDLSDPAVMEAMVKKITVEIDMDNEEIEKLQNKTLQLEETLNDTRKSVFELLEKQPKILEDISKLTKLVAKIEANVAEINSTMVRKDMLIPTEYDEQHNCKVGCSRIQGVPNNCQAAMETGNGKVGVYLQQLPGSELKPFGAYCTRILESEWTVIQRRQDGSVGFRELWNEYENGFGNLDGEYWLGLKRIHALTTQLKHKLWIQMTDFKGKTRFALYSEFSVAGADENYRLTLGGFTGTVEDSMETNKGMMFSTSDKDNDMDKDINCAARNGGWWYRACTYVNLNGRYNRIADGITNAGVYWKGLKGYDALKTVVMAIQPI